MDLRGRRDICERGPDAVKFESAEANVSLILSDTKKCQDTGEKIEADQILNSESRSLIH